MLGKIKEWLPPFDIAQLIQSKVDFSSWKGDEHIKGVWFNDSHGCTLNKVMAVRVKCASEDKEGAFDESLFYSLSAFHDRLDEQEDGSPVLSEQFPFINMKVKPKKHFLLFDQEEISKKDIEKIFTLTESHAIIRVKPQPIIDALGSINNKRDRERSVSSLTIIDNQLTIHIFKRHSRKLLTTSAKETVDCELLASPIQYTKEITADLNAHTLLYLLSMFCSFSAVALYVARDRIMITSDDCAPHVEVVVARLKTV